ncbi:MAG: hypothetical protein AAGG06_05860 [Pseudomonadota bacterium]
MSPDPAAMLDMPDRIDRIVFTGDLLRVDDRRAARGLNPDRGEVAWLNALMAPVLCHVLDLPAVTLLLDEVTAPVRRQDVYAMHGVEFTAQGWAWFYDRPLLAEAEAVLAPLFDGALAVAFAAPPYLRRLWQARDVPFIDFALHPIRFLADDLLGLRSNLAPVAAALQGHVLAASTLALPIRLLQAQARLHLGPVPEAGSVLFLGQDSRSAPLIAEGRLAGLADLRLALVAAASRYGSVYFHADPVADDPALYAMVEAIPRVEWLTGDLHGILASGRLAKVESLSAPALMEAALLGLETARVLPGGAEAAGPGATITAERYAPMLPRILAPQVWSDAFQGVAGAGGAPDLAAGLLRQSRWALEAARV